jgi:hypothetical protein
MFGRRKAEDDPFAALKDGGTYQSSPVTLPEMGLGGDAPTNSPTPPASPLGLATSDPVMSPPPAAPPPATPPVARPNRTTSASFRSAYGYGRGMGWVWRVVALGIVSIVVGSAVLHLGNTTHSIKIPSFNFNTGTGATPTTGSSTSAGKTHAQRPTAYLTASGLHAGLAHVGRLVHGAKLTLLRVDARTFSVYATRPNGRTSQVYFSPTVTFVNPAALPGERPLPAASIRPRVLGSLVTQLHRRFGIPPSRIDYAVVSSPSGLPPQWLLFVKNASHQAFAAPVSGGALTKL